MFQILVASSLACCLAAIPPGEIPGPQHADDDTGAEDTLRAGPFFPT